LIVPLNVLVDGEARGELDFAFCACSRSFSRGRDPEVKGDDFTVVVAAVRKKETTRWKMRCCASRLCNKHAHRKLNVEGRSFILLFVCHLSRMPEFVVVVDGDEEVNWKWLCYH